MNPYVQKGPRSHHFAASISVVVGFSLLLEHYTLNVVFSVLDGITPLTGQQLWGVILIVLGTLVLPRISIVMRGLVLSLLSLVWICFGLFVLWASLIGPQAGTIGSYTGILSIAMAVVCILAETNLKRDYFKPPLDR